MITVLNRRLSNYIFYGILVLIVVIILLIRSVTLGVKLQDISDLERNNISLQKRIDLLEQTVQENKDVQTNDLYELYDIIPNIYSGPELENKTYAILESLGVNESDDMQRTVYVNEYVNLDGQTDFADLVDDYYVVEVRVSFTTVDVDVLANFIDELYNAEQLFIISDLNYTVPIDENFVEVQVHFYAIYDVDIIEEES